MFTKRDNLSATALSTTDDEQQMNTELMVHADGAGSCVNNGTDEARAGSCVWHGDKDPRNTAIRVPGMKQSNHIGKLLAILHAVENAPGNQPVKIRRDSRFAICGLTKYARDWEVKA